MKKFAKDHKGMYPDSVYLDQTADDTLRHLIQDKIIYDERIFGCPEGFYPDGHIGMSPDFKMALQPGENHWAMTAGLADTSPGNLPLIFENPAIASWPPQWNADLSGGKVGRTWAGGTIIIGRNDGSVKVEKLSGKKGMVGPQERPGGMTSFAKDSSGLPMRVLTIIAK